MSKCNKDCFNCVFDDCIADSNNDLSSEELKQIREEEREIERRREIMDENTDYRRRWELMHRDQVRETKKKYYERNKEKCNARSREYYNTHKQQILEQQKKYKQENRDIYHAEYVEKREKLKTIAG